MRQNIKRFREQNIKEKQQKKYLQVQNNGNKKKKKTRTIYEFFKDYSKEEIDEMLTTLNEEEKDLIAIRYGKDLNNPISTKLTKDQIYKFYGLLVPKMKRLLNKFAKKKSLKI